MGVQINGSEGNVIATKGTFSGDVGIGGTLTYEDVTNIDSVGLITARSGIEIGARPGVAASISVDGNAIFSGITTVGGNADIEGALVVGNGVAAPLSGFSAHFHADATSNRIQITTSNTGVTNADGAIIMIDSGSNMEILNRENSNIEFFTNNSQRMTLDSSGRLLLGTTTEGESTLDDLTIATSGDTGMTIRSGTSNNGAIGFSDGTSGADEYRGLIDYDHNGNYFRFYTNASERVRIDSDGRLLVGATTNNSSSARAILRGFAGDGGTGQGILHLEVNRTTTNCGADEALGGVRFASNEGHIGAEFSASAESAWTGSGDLPTYFRFRSCADGSGSLTERLRIASNGQVRIGDGAASDYSISNDVNAVLQLTAASTPKAVFIRNDTSVVDGNYLGLIDFHSRDGGPVRCARIGAVASGDHATDDNPTDLIFRTCPDGSASDAERLRIHSNGCVTKPANAMFKAVRTSNQTVSSVGWHVIQYNDDSATGCFDIGGNFDTSNYRFTAPITGYYQFGLNQRIDSGDGSGNYFRVAFTVDGAGLGGSYPYGHAIYRDDDGFSYYTFSITSLIYLTAGQYVRAEAYSDSDTNWTLQDESQFYGYLVG